MSRHHEPIDTPAPSVTLASMAGRRKQLSGKERAVRDMAAAWSFYQQGPTDPVRNPISGEFFSTETVGDLTAILDAKTAGIQER